MSIIRYLKATYSVVLAIALLLSVASLITTADTTEVPPASLVINWEAEDTSIVSSSSTVVSYSLVTSPTIIGSNKAIKIVSSNANEITGSNYVKINLDPKSTATARDIKVNLTSSVVKNLGNMAHYGVVIGGTIYWEQAYMGGTVPLSTDGYKEISLVGRSFKSLKGNIFQSNGSYDVAINVKSTNIYKVQDIVVAPVNNFTAVYVDDITIVDKNDIPTVAMPKVSKVFCDWNGAVDHVKSESPGKTYNDISMPNAFSATNGIATINTDGYTFKSLQVQPELSLDTTQTKAAIDAAKAGDGYLYIKIRFLGALNGNGSDCGLKFNMYVFDDGEWQNAVYIVNESMFSMMSVGEQLVKFNVSGFGNMVPDTIAVNIINENYYSCLTRVNVEFSSIYASDGIWPSSTNLSTIISSAKPTITAPITSITSIITESTTVTKATATVKTVLYGDCNDDGIINSKDVLILRKYIAKISNKINFMAADCNGDGAVNSKDVLLIRKYNAKLLIDLRPKI